MGDSLKIQTIEKKIFSKKPTMKLVATALSAVFGMASASMESLHASINAAMAARANRTGRAFTGAVANAFEPINGYGCWCYLDAEWRDEEKQQINRASILAHGKIVDDMDASCRDLINSYKCIEMDAEKNGIEDCDAQAVEYVQHSFIQNVDVTQDCNIKNPNNECAANACIVEATFIIKFLDYMPPNGPPSPPTQTSTPTTNTLPKAVLLIQTPTAQVFQTQSDPTKNVVVNMLS